MFFNGNILIADQRTACAEQMRSAGFTVTCVRSTSAVLSAAEEVGAELIILNLPIKRQPLRMLLQQIYEKTQMAVIIAVSDVQLCEELVERSLVDDFVVLPFSSQELALRARTVLRKREQLHDKGLPKSDRIGELVIDYNMRRITLCGRVVNLTVNEYSIVEMLFRCKNTVVPYDVVIHRLWGPFCSDDNRVLRVYMSNIRRKIEPDSKNPQYIRTLHGVGYMICDCCEDEMNEENTEKVKNISKTS